MTPWITLSFFLLGLAVAWPVIPVIIRRAQSVRTTRERSFHQTHSEAIPRFGGVALALAFVVVVACAFAFLDLPLTGTRENLGMVGTALAMFALGVADDFRPLGARKKLIGQTAIAVVACFFVSHVEVVKNPITGAEYQLGYGGLVFTIFWLVAFTNLINLVDGIDGLAGGLALMLMVLLAFVGSSGGAILPVCCAAGVAGALVAFLRFNFPPARIYLGDGGAYLLGFLIGILAMRQSQKGAVVAALIAPLFALALPIIDVTLAILRRGLRGLPVFRPDRKHLHHKLLGEGFSRRKTVLVLYGFSVICLLMAFGVYWSKGRWAPIFLGLVSLLILVTASRLNFARPWLSPANLIGSTLEVRKASQYALALCQWFELEAERSPSLEALWGDFEFLVRKLELARVCVETDAGPKVWEGEALSSETEKFECVLPLNHAVYRQIAFAADATRMTDRVFDQVTELAAEAWIKGVTRWHAANAPS